MRLPTQGQVPGTVYPHRAAWGVGPDPVIADKAVLVASDPPACGGGASVRGPGASPTMCDAGGRRQATGLRARVLPAPPVSLMSALDVSGTVLAPSKPSMIHLAGQSGLSAAWCLRSFELWLRRCPRSGTIGPASAWVTCGAWECTLNKSLTLGD